MTKQVQIGKDSLNFVKQSDTGLSNCPDLTPTPTPTVACVTVNLKSSVACNSYVVKDSYRSVSTDKLGSAIKISDNEVVLTGYGSCLSIGDSMPVARSILGKINLDTIQKSDGSSYNLFNIDNDFGTKGKVNTIFYDVNNLKVFSRFDHALTQTVSGQIKILVAGQTDYKALVARYSSTGVPDRTFGNGSGYVSLDILDQSIKLLDVFGIFIQTDNKILVFCNGYDIINKRSVGIIVRLTNSGTVDSTFNASKGYIQVRSELSEFDGSKFVGKTVYSDRNSLYIVFETFSSIKQNTVIITRLDLSTGLLDDKFANSGYLYSNLDNNNTYFHNIFVKNNTIHLVINGNNSKIQINTYNSELGTLNVLSPLVISDNIFSISDIAGQSGQLKVKFTNLRCDLLDLDTEVVLFFNVQLQENSLDALGSSRQSLLHWLEKQALFSGDFNYDSLTYRDCTITPCDRQPEDSYGTMDILSQNITKYNTTSRVLFGYVKLTNNFTTASSLKLDRFNELSEHNIIKKVIQLSTNNYVAVGYYGNNTYSNFGIKTITLANDNKAFGPRPNEILGSIDFSDFCNTVLATEDGIVIEECPCAPAITPTPTPTSPPLTSDVFIGNITDSCDNEAPVLNVSWAKNKSTVVGSYVIQISKASDKIEIISASFNITDTEDKGVVNINVSSLDTKTLNNKTCLAAILDNTGSTVYSKIFVLNIRNCA